MSSSGSSGFLTGDAIQRTFSKKFAPSPKTLNFNNVSTQCTQGDGLQLGQSTGVQWASRSDESIERGVESLRACADTGRLLRHWSCRTNTACCGVLWTPRLPRPARVCGLCEEGLLSHTAPTLVPHNWCSVPWWADTRNRGGFSLEQKTC